MLKSRKKTIILLIVVLLFTAGLVAVYLHFYKAVNKKYPEPVVITRTFGEQAVITPHIKLVVNSCQYMTMEEFRQMVPDYEKVAYDRDGSLLTDDELRVYLIKVTAGGVFNMDMGNFIDNIQLVSGTDWASIDDDLLRTLNPDLSFSKDEYGQKAITIPYFLYSCNFEKNDWKTIDNRKYDLVLCTDPIKYIVKLQ